MMISGKLPGKYLYLIRSVLTLLMFVSATAVSAVEAEKLNKVFYDKGNDRLTVTVEDVSLRLVLSRISLSSGLEVMFDDAAEDVLTIDLQSNSLKDGLERILKGRSSIMRYSRDDKGEVILVGVMVLPTGVQDQGRAKRLVSVEDEAYYRAKSELTMEQYQQVNMAKQRWQARLDELPLKLREAMEKHVEEKLQVDAEQERREEEKRAKREKRDAKKLADREKKRNNILQAMDEEQRIEFERSGAAARENMKELIHGDKY